MHRDIADTVFIRCVGGYSLYLTLQSYCWIIYYCTRIEVSVLRAGGGVLTEKKIPGVIKRKKIVLFPTNYFLKNVPGVLKRKTNFGGQLGSGYI